MSLSSSRDIEENTSSHTGALSSGSKKGSSSSQHSSLMVWRVSAAACLTSSPRHEDDEDGDDAEEATSAVSEPMSSDFAQPSHCVSLSESTDLRRSSKVHRAFQ
jgi:hypothetical protein